MLPSTALKQMKKTMFDKRQYQLRQYKAIGLKYIQEPPCFMWYWYMADCEPLHVPPARLTLHSTKLCTNSKIFRKKLYFLVLRLALRHFYAFDKIWRSLVLREAHKRKFELFDVTLIFQGHLNVFWGWLMAFLCSSRWSDQKCCKTECVALKTSFRTRPMWAL